MSAPKNKSQTHRIRPIHKRLVLHTSSVLLLLGGSFLPMPVTYHADSAALQVSAKVAAPLPTGPAVISYPHNQQHVTSPNQTVTGSCPDQSYVRLYNGGNVVGVAICSANFFTVQVTLLPGENTLQARVYNITDDEGPASPPINVYYDAPVTPPPTPPATNPAKPLPAPTPGSPEIVQPLTLTVPFYYKVHTPNEQWQWNLAITGGKPPYSVNIVWDDGQSEHFTHNDSLSLVITHTYKKAGVYQPLIQVTDTDGHLATFQLLAVVADGSAPAIAQVVRSFFSGANPWVVWPVYGTAAVAIGVFWIWEIIALLRRLGWISTVHKHRV